MKNNYLLINKKIVIFYILFLFAIGLPISVFGSMCSGQPSCCALYPNDDTCGGGGGSSSGSSGSSGATPVGNPITKFLNNVINFLLIIATPIAVIMVIIAGFYFMTAQGDSGKIETAKKMILWVLIGMAIVLMAKAAVNFVRSSV